MVFYVMELGQLKTGPGVFQLQDKIVSPTALALDAMNLLGVWKDN